MSDLDVAAAVVVKLAQHGLIDVRRMNDVCHTLGVKQAHVRAVHPWVVREGWRSAGTWTEWAQAQLDAAAVSVEEWRRAVVERDELAARLAVVEAERDEAVALLAEVSVALDERAEPVLRTEPGVRGAVRIIGKVPKNNRRGEGYTQLPRLEGEPETRTCSLCPEGRNVHPIELFQVLEKRKNRAGEPVSYRDSYCIPCRASLGRGYYLTQQKRAQLRSLGVAAPPGASMLVCLVCDQPIRADQRAALVEMVAHVECAAEVRVAAAVDRRGHLHAV